MLSDKHKEIINHINENYLYGRCNSEGAAIAVALMTGAAMIAEAIQDGLCKEHIGDEGDNLVTAVTELNKTISDIWGS